MTQELKDKALDILRRCTVDGNAVRLPAETIDTEVWTVVKDALVNVNGRYRKATNLFVFNPYENQLAEAIEWLELEEVTTYDVPALFAGPETIEAEAEEEEPKKPKQFIKERRTLRYDFTAAEVHDLALQLAGDNSKLSAIEEEKSQQAAHYGAVIKEIKARLNKISILITNGYDMRDVECEIYYNQPEPGKKTIIRTDTGKADVQRMEPYEYNLFTQPVEEEELAG